MKKLILIRHARAEDPVPEFTDFERSLTLKGKTISRLMARKLIEKENSPGIMISSSAFRALETAYIFAEEFGIDPAMVKINSSFYYKMNIQFLSEVLSVTSDENNVMMLFGHNPSLTEIADRLCTKGCDFIPKCGIVCISFNISKWSEISQRTGKTEYFLKPEKVL
jgi:phosphohistidine phosphatase